MGALREGSARSDGDKREDLTDQREAVLDAPEARADTRDAAEADRKERASLTLADADERDDQAETRDAAAMPRDTAAGSAKPLDDQGPAEAMRPPPARGRTAGRAVMPRPW